LSLGELLDRTFQIYRKHFVVLVGIAALPALLPAAVNMLSLQTRLDLGIAASLIFLPFLWLVQLVAGAVSQAATITAVSEIHLGRPISIGAAFSAAKESIVPICVISVVMGLVVMVGFACLIVPGILLALRWAVVIPVVVVEGLPMRAAMSRSSALTEGHRGRVFAIYAMYVVVVMVVSSMWQVPLGVAAVLNSKLNAFWLAVGTYGTAFLTQCLVGPLLTTSLSLFYYDERVRKEAFDLDHMMANPDVPGASPAVTA
jgi:hypothetical protein